MHMSNAADNNSPHAPEGKVEAFDELVAEVVALYHAELLQLLRAH